MNTREQWLENATNKLGPIFKTKGYEIPKVRLAIGFTKLGQKHTVLGSCWDKAASNDGVPQIYISPTTEDSLSILETLTHELVHAVVGNDKGHGKVFKRCALAVGLEGKMRSTNAGPELRERLNVLISDIGPIPHSQLNPALSGKKKQSTRLLKAICAQSEFKVRITQGCIDTFGLPVCPCHNESMEIESCKN